MDPVMLLRDLDPANNFAMNGLAMHFACILIADGHTLPPRLFTDIMVDKAETLHKFIITQHIGLCLTANIRAQSATFHVYDTFSAYTNMLLQFTITNTLDLENHLFELYSEIHSLVDTFLPEEEDEMPPLEDHSGNGSDPVLVL